MGHWFLFHVANVSRAKEAFLLFVVLGPVNTTTCIMESGLGVSLASRIHSGFVS